MLFPLTGAYYPNNKCKGLTGFNNKHYSLSSAVFFKLERKHESTGKSC